MSLEDLIHDAYEHLFDVGDVFLESDYGGQADNFDDDNNPFRKMLKQRKLIPRVIDDLTLQWIEVPSLFKTIDHTRTRMGRLTLFRSLIQPSVSLELLQEKQKSYQELKDDSEIRESLGHYINSIAGRERYFLNHVYGNYSFYLDAPTDRYMYSVAKNSMRFIRDMIEKSQELPTPSTPYVQTLLRDIQELNGSDEHELAIGPVYLTFGGLKGGRQIFKEGFENRLKGFFMPRIRFRCSYLKPELLLLPVVPLIPAAYGAIIHNFGFIAGGSAATMGIVLEEAFLYAFLVRQFDDNFFVRPLANKFSSKKVRRAVEAVGKIDELLSFVRYSETRGEFTVPTLEDSPSHHFIARKIRNPILSYDNRNFVPNDVELNGQKLTFITGPNSGGKTTYCKSIAQLQLMAQSGGPIPAKEAEISIANRIFYQMPTPGSLKNPEGQFGTDLTITAGIFYQTTPKSLVIMDTLAEGTTYEEKIKQSQKILNGFAKKRNNTILITHNHELVRMYRDKGTGSFLMVEFDGEKPTYRLRPGISTVSHAELIAKKVGFSKEDINKHLKSMGYV